MKSGRPMKLALVEFHHGRGCTLGQYEGGCGYECRYDVVEEIATIPGTSTSPRYPTPRAAIEAHAKGRNVRCNLCGSWGGEWLPGLRPGWGSLAACPEHAAAIKAEIARHKVTMATLSKVNFDQDHWTWERDLNAYDKEQRKLRKQREAHEREERRLEREARQAEKAAYDEAHQEALPAHGIFEQGSADR